MLGNGQSDASLGITVCRIRDYVAFGNMLYSGLCRIRDYVVFEIMLHLGLCHIWYSVVRDYVVRDNGAWA